MECKKVTITLEEIQIGKLGVTVEIDPPKSWKGMSVLMATILKRMLEPALKYTKGVVN